MTVLKLRRSTRDTPPSHADDVRGCRSHRRRSRRGTRSRDPGRPRVVDARSPGPGARPQRPRSPWWSRISALRRGLPPRTAAPESVRFMALSIGRIGRSAWMHGVFRSRCHRVASPHIGVLSGTQAARVPERGPDRGLCVAVKNHRKRPVCRDFARVELGGFEPPTSWVRWRRRAFRPAYSAF